jgi:2',3'-cyclic-nucleotide 2'-phosphodiesterase (5'-nucleotidase family)
MIILLTHFPIINNEVVEEKYEDDFLKSYYTNDLFDELEDGKLIACLHGHTHYSIDIFINKIRFISNAMGYSHEETLFKIDKVHKIDF